MIYASATQSKLVVTTSPQNRTFLGNNYFTWRISNRDSFESWTFAPDNLSQSLYYFSFTMSIGSPEVFTGSNVILDLDQGEYHYSIYQTSIQYDLGLTNSLGLIEVGLLIVDGTSSQPQQFTASNDDTVKVFTDI